MRLPVTAVTIMVTVACYGILSSAENQVDPTTREVAFLKKALGLEKTPASQSTQPTMRVWLGLDEKMDFLRGWSMASSDTDAVMPFGMSRTYFLTKSLDRRESSIIRVFIGSSAEAAREMALQRIALTSVPLDLLAETLRVSVDGPGDLAIMSGRRGEAPKAIVCLVRDNIAVIFQGPDSEAHNIMAKSIDEKIKKSAGLNKSEYEKLCPRIVVKGSQATDGPRAKHFTVTLLPAENAGNCEIVGMLEDGSKGTYEPKEGAVHFSVGRDSRVRYYSIGVYDRKSLLSNWTTAEVPWRLPDSKPVASRPTE